MPTDKQSHRLAVKQLNQARKRFAICSTSFSSFHCQSGIIFQQNGRPPVPASGISVIKNNKMSFIVFKYISKLRGGGGEGGREGGKGEIYCKLEHFCFLVTLISLYPVMS